MATPFFDFISKNYNKIKRDCELKIARIGLAFDEDIFSDTILKCNDKLKKESLQGKDMLAYFWVSFKTNTLREIGYLRNNTTDEIPDIADEAEYDDFTELYNNVSDFIIKRFGEELFHLFSLHSNGVLYRELYKMTDITDLKYKFRQIREETRKTFTRE